MVLRASGSVYGRGKQSPTLSREEHASESDTVLMITFARNRGNFSRSSQDITTRWHEQVRHAPAERGALSLEFKNPGTTPTQMPCSEAAAEDLFSMLKSDSREGSTPMNVCCARCC
jgi:hypothetical protein